LIGAGRMGGALLAAGQAKIGPVIASSPIRRPNSRPFARTHHVALFAHAASIDTVRARALHRRAQTADIEDADRRARAHRAVRRAGCSRSLRRTSIATMSKSWGRQARIVRAMPNTPGSIGRGITAIFAAKGTTAERQDAGGKSLLAALGETVWVQRERDIDAVTRSPLRPPTFSC